jgi:thiol-disulfide isomerase/thioredoxin
MVFLNITTKNYNIKDKNGKTKMDILDDMINSNDCKIFILFYMEGCGPCNATRPEWEKLKNVFKKYNHNDKIAIVDIDQVLSSKISKIKPPNSFPTMKFITEGGKISENYEDSNIETKDRTIDSFVSWINSKIHIDLNDKNHKNHNSKKNRIKRGGTKKMNKRKWSRKYKMSINCKKPKGFSQKQYCRYGRK